MILGFFATGCVTATQTSGDAICDGTRAARADHAAVLAETPDVAALQTGARLIRQIDAACR